MKLADYQQTLLNALHKQDDVSLPFSISHDDTVSADTRLSIYRNSIMGGRLAALQQIFPCIEKLVGHDCFQQLGEQFILQHPSIDIAINNMGKDFAAFLNNLSINSEVPYLADMAHFEWLWHQVFHGTANSEIDYEKLASTIAAVGEAIILRQALGLQCLQSAYPLHKLWEMCQPEYQDDFMLLEENGINYVALVQRKQRIHIETLTLPQSHLLQLLDEPKTLADLCINFAQLEDALLFDQVLPQLYASGLIVVEDSR